MRVREFGGALVLLLMSVAGPARAGLALSADLEVTKTGPAVAAPDSDVAYDIAINNLSPDPASNVTLSDAIPPGMTFVSATQNSGVPFSCATPAAGTSGTVTCDALALPGLSSASFTLVFHIDPGTPTSTFFTNIATVSSALDENEENNSATAVTSTPSAPVADLAIQKSGPSVAASDTDISYSIVVTNAGPDSATSAGWTDTLPGDLTFVGLSQDSGPSFACTTPAIGSGGMVQCSLASFSTGSAEFTLTAHVPAGAASGTNYLNSASVNSDNDPNDENDSSATNTVILSAEVAVAKSAPASVTAGQTISYVLNVLNAGPDAALALTLSDALPAPLTFAGLSQDNGPTMTCQTPPVGVGGTIECSIAAMPAGASAQFTLAATVPSTYTGPPVSNTVTSTHESFDADGSNNSASATTAVTPLPVDIAAGKIGPTTIAGGQNVSYTLTVSNVGANAATGVTLSDPLPAGSGFVSFAQNTGPSFACTTPALGANGTVNCTLALLPAGTSATFTLVASIPASAVDGSMLTNTLVAGSAAPDSDNGNNSASATTTVANQADLAVIKSAPGNVTAGANLIYGLSLTNTGPSPALTVQLSDALPVGTTFQALQQTSGPAASCTTPAVGAAGTVTCTWAMFANATSASFDLTVGTQAGALNGTSLSNTATATAATADPNASNNSSTVVTTVTNQADLALTKAGPATAIAGSTLNYTLTLAYNGAAAPAANVQMSDPIPAGTTFVSLTQTSGPTFACTTPAVGTNGTVDCTIGTLANATPATFSLIVNVPTSLSTGGVLVNSATSSTTSPDVSPGNNTASSTATVSNNVDLSLSKSGPSSLVVGLNATYTLTLANVGTSPALAVQLTDPLPSGTSFVSLTQTTGPAMACTTPAVGATGTVTCTTASFPGGASAIFTLIVGTDGATPGMLTNSASVTSSSTEAGQVNNAASAGTTLVPSASQTFRAIPTLSMPWLILLAAVLALAAMATSSRLSGR